MGKIRLCVGKEEDCLVEAIETHLKKKGVDFERVNVNIDIDIALVDESNVIWKGLGEVWECIELHIRYGIWGKKKIKHRKTIKSRGRK